MHRTDGADHFLWTRILEQVPRRSRVESRAQVTGFAKAAQDDDVRRVREPSQFCRGLDAVEHWHHQIHQHQVRTVAGLDHCSHGVDGDPPVRRFADNSDVGGEFEHGAKPAPHQSVIIHQVDTDGVGVCCFLWSVGHRISSCQDAITLVLSYAAAINDDIQPASRLDVFTERALEIARDGDLEMVVRQLTTAFEAATGMMGSLIVLIDADTGDPTFAGGQTARRAHLAAMEECRRRGAPMTIWQAFTENRVVVERHWSEIVHSDPRLEAIRPFLDLAPGDSAPVTYVAVPLTVADRSLGVIAAGVDPSVTIGADHIARWNRLAHDIALALHYSAAIRSARESGADRERQRLNEELHDSVSQDLFALSFLAARAVDDLGRDGRPEIAEEVAELRDLTEQISVSVRSLIGERRGTPSGATLSGRLKGLSGEVARRTGIRVHVTVSEEWDDVSRESADEVVRIVQEAFRNIEKHARATTASVRLVRDPAAANMLLIEIVDDGVVFDQETTRPESFGLSSIRERVSEQGGSVEITSVPSKTLTIRMHLTFRSEWDAAQRQL
jgi:signal transduction histidine kinase